MAEINSHPLLATDTVAVWDVLCSGTSKHKSAEECVSTTHLCFLTAASTCIIQVRSRQSRKRIRWCSLMKVNPIELAILVPLQRALRASPGGLLPPVPRGRVENSSDDHPRRMTRNTWLFVCFTILATAGRSSHSS